MIEKRIINGQAVGYNTETRSYCNLPKNFDENQDDNSEKKPKDENQDDNSEKKKRGS